MRHVIIGAGAAGIAAAEHLRKLDAEASITVLDGEGEVPYARMAIPYMLSDRIGEDGMHLRHDPDHYRTLRIDIEKGRAASVDTAARTIRLADGRIVAYDRLLIAAGSVPSHEPIEGIDLPGVHTCWTLADARASLELVTAMYASARSGEVVTLPLPTDHPLYGGWLL